MSKKIIGSGTITLTEAVDIAATYYFYRLGEYDDPAPVRPTDSEAIAYINSGTVPSGWSTDEPGYVEGSTAKLYYIILTEFTDGTGAWSGVILSSAYEASRTAYNKSVVAINSANAAKTAADNAEASASAAQTSASEAKTQADSAATSAQKAIDDAASAASAASAAQSSADNAAALAGQAKARADEVDEEATKAISDIRDDVDRVETETKSSLESIRGDVADAKTAADNAQASAKSATTAASNASRAADAAQASANNASEYAARALGNLSTVQSVSETLEWITKHGTMTQTTDTALDPSHVYFVLDPNGDYAVGDKTYSVVSEPNVNDLSNYYVLSIDESLNNYVGTHLVVTSEGLWIIPEEDGNKVLIATGNGEKYKSAGTYIIDSDGNTVALFSASGSRIGKDDESHMVLDYRSLKLIDENHSTYLYVSDLREKQNAYTEEATMSFAAKSYTPPTKDHRDYREPYNIEIDDTRESTKIFISNYDLTCIDIIDVNINGISYTDYTIGEKVDNYIKYIVVSYAVRDGDEITVHYQRRTTGRVFEETCRVLNPESDYSYQYSWDEKVIDGKQYYTLRTDGSAYDPVTSPTGSPAENLYYEYVNTYEYERLNCKLYTTRAVSKIISITAGDMEYTYQNVVYHPAQGSRDLNVITLNSPLPQSTDIIVRYESLPNNIYKIENELHEKTYEGRNSYTTNYAIRGDVSVINNDDGNEIPLLSAQEARDWYKTQTQTSFGYTYRIFRLESDGGSIIIYPPFTTDSNGEPVLEVPNAILVSYTTDSKRLKAYTFGTRKDGSLIGAMSFACGKDVVSSGLNAMAEGAGTTSSGSNSHAEGLNTVSSSLGSHSEGMSTTASGLHSHSEGENTVASSYDSHAEGDSTKASGAYSHSECYHTVASGWRSHAECNSTTASGDNSHSEGYYAVASGWSSHAEGDSTTASGLRSHAEGWGSKASGDSSHAQNNHTIAASANQTALGRYNKSDEEGKYAVIVGGGTSSLPKNILTIDWKGNVEQNGVSTFSSAPTKIPASANLNDYKTTGSYYASSSDSSTQTNVPAEYDDYQMIVFNFIDMLSGGCIQIAWTNNVSSSIKYRIYKNWGQTWGEWTDLVKASDITPTEITPGIDLGASMSSKVTDIKTLKIYANEATRTCNIQGCASVKLTGGTEENLFEFLSTYQPKQTNVALNVYANNNTLIKALVVNSTESFAGITVRAASAYTGDLYFGGSWVY